MPKLKSLTHAAIVNRDGTHSTKAAPDQNWNDELLKAVRATVEPLFLRLSRDWTTSLTSSVGKSVNVIIQNLIRILEDDPAADIAGAGVMFLMNLEHRQAEVEKKCEESDRDLAKRFR